MILIKRLKENNSGGNIMALFKCPCGRTRTATLSQVRCGRVTACNKCSKEIGLKKFIIARRTHGKKGTRIYRIYRAMINRCFYKKDTYIYNNYGGRGITVCKRWMKFENFYADMGEPPSPLHSLDRIDNNKNYCKSNCRWATHKEQQRNSRNCTYYTYKGVTACLSELCEKLNMPYLLVWDRINRSNWSLEKAMTTPKMVNKYK